MLIEIITKNPDNKDDPDFLQIKFDGRQQFYVFDGERIDNNLSKNFSQCFMIKNMLEKVYKAGRDLEDVEFKFTEI
jgi:hypothetical protein